MSTTDCCGEVEVFEERPEKRKYPDYCRTITFTDNNGVVRELVFPKALDLDRPKRARTTFSREQLDRLEAEFTANQYLVGRERSHLAITLGLSETQVKVWFQNRRTKHKREKEKQDDGGDSASTKPFAANLFGIGLHQDPAPPLPALATPLFDHESLSFLGGGGGGTSVHSVRSTSDHHEPLTFLGGGGTSVHSTRLESDHHEPHTFLGGGVTSVHSARSMSDHHESRSFHGSEGQTSAVSTSHHENRSFLRDPACWDDFLLFSKFGSAAPCHPKDLVSFHAASSGSVPVRPVLSLSGSDSVRPALSLSSSGIGASVVRGAAAGGPECLGFPETARRSLDLLHHHHHQHPRSGVNDAQCESLGVAGAGLLGGKVPPLGSYLAACPLPPLESVMGGELHHQPHASFPGGPAAPSVRSTSPHRPHHALLGRSSGDPLSIDLTPRSNFGDRPQYELLGSGAGLRGEGPTGAYYTACLLRPPGSMTGRRVPLVPSVWPLYPHTLTR